MTEVEVTNREFKTFVTVCLVGAVFFFTALTLGWRGESWNTYFLLFAVCMALWSMQADTRKIRREKARDNPFS